MMNRRRLRRIGPAAVCVIILALLPAAVCTAQAPVTRQEALAIAESYRMFAWTPTAQNIRHGIDRAGVRVDTPDAAFRRPGSRPGWWVAGGRNIGVPYQWGGFSSLADFADGIRAGRPAGDIYTADKRARLEGAVSREAVGIDCSGLISRCWKLDHAYSTRTLPGLCVELPSYDALRPADILNSDNNHVLLFAGWKDPAHQRFYAYEAGSPPSWKVLLTDVPVELVRARGYRAFRYRLIRE